MEEICIDDIEDLPATHFFIYKGKQFPFNMNIFKCYSQYFNSIEHQYEENSNINLFDDSEDDQNISESSINDFINFCQRKKIILNKSNVLILHKLSKKYVISSLLKATNKYISSHIKEVVIDLLLISQNDCDDTNNHEYEEMISDNLTEYFQNSQLLSLPLPVLHRIVTKYAQKNKNSEEQSKFIEFLFKCLDRFGRKASVLFEHSNIGGCGGTFLRRLFNEYSGIFDFHFINDQQLRTIYDLESDIIEQNKQMKEADENSKISIDSMQQKLFELEKENEKLRSMIDETNRSKESQIQQVETNFNQQLNELREQISQLNQKVTQQSSMKKMLKLTKKSFMFSSDSSPKGVIASLGEAVTISAGGNISTSKPLSNITKDDNSHFYSKGSSDSPNYIKFDFGNSKRIDLYSYFIRSNNGPASTSYSHPKTWRIEGSNDDSNWTPLDQRENDNNLYGSYKQHHFVCQENSHGDENSMYRYIRYLQEKTWCDPFSIYITYFELYGDVFDNY